MLQSEDCGISALWHIVMLWHIAVLHADGGVRMMQRYVYENKGLTDAESDGLFGNNPNMSRVKRNGDTF